MHPTVFKAALALFAEEYDLDVSDTKIAKFQSIFYGKKVPNPDYVEDSKKENEKNKKIDAPGPFGMINVTPSMGYPKETPKESFDGLTKKEQKLVRAGTSEKTFAGVGDYDYELSVSTKKGVERYRYKQHGFPKGRKKPLIAASKVEEGETMEGTEDPPRMYVSKRRPNSLAKDSNPNSVTAFWDLVDKKPTGSTTRPTTPAKDLKVGDVREGQDGNSYVVKENKNGNNYWAPNSPKGKTAAKATTKPRKSKTPTVQADSLSEPESDAEDSAAESESESDSDAETDIPVKTARSAKK